MSNILFFYPVSKWRCYLSVTQPQITRQEVEKRQDRNDIFELSTFGRALTFECNAVQQRVRQTACRRCTLTQSFILFSPSQLVELVVSFTFSRLTILYPSSHTTGTKTVTLAKAFVPLFACSLTLRGGKSKAFWEGNTNTYHRKVE